MLINILFRIQSELAQRVRELNHKVNDIRREQSYLRVSSPASYMPCKWSCRHGSNDADLLLSSCFAMEFLCHPGT